MSQKSEIKVSANRRFNLGNFEFIEINLEQKDIIEFSSLEERNKKTQEMSFILANNFKKSTEEIFGIVGLQEKNATFISDKEKPMSNSTNKNEIKSSTEDLDL